MDQRRDGEWRDNAKMEGSVVGEAFVASIVWGLEYNLFSMLGEMGGRKAWIQISLSLQRLMNYI